MRDNCGYLVIFRCVLRKNSEGRTGKRSNFKLNAKGGLHKFCVCLLELAMLSLPRLATFLGGALLK